MEWDECEGVWFQMNGLAVCVFDDGWMQASGSQRVAERFRIFVGEFFFKDFGGCPASEEGEAGVRTDEFEFSQMDVGAGVGSFPGGYAHD